MQKGRRLGGRYLTYCCALPGATAGSAAGPRAYGQGRCGLCRDAPRQRGRTGGVGRGSGRRGGLPKAPRSSQAQSSTCAGLACWNARGVGRRAGSALSWSGGRVRARGGRCRRRSALRSPSWPTRLCPGRGGRRGGASARRLDARHAPDRLADARAGGGRARDGVADDQLDRGDPRQSNHNPHRHCGRQAKPASVAGLHPLRRRRQQLGPSISVVSTRVQPPDRTAGGPGRLRPGPPSARRAAALPPGPGTAHRPPCQPSRPLTRRRRRRACPARPGTTRPEPQSRRPVSYPPPAAGSTPKPTAPRTR